ncbi:hypothetical protein TYRP_018902 [Tyrophagus putrescentiae]|nr:hypothetical protein TYRP_018902 [Tyrophagus putrescentiae]
MSEFYNFSCEHLGSFGSQRSTLRLTVQLLVIFLITVLIIVFNVGTIFILHSKQYSCHLRELPKTLMTSLSITDLAMGVLITPVCFISLAKGCFPFRKEICELQALLISSLFHSSSLLLISIAVDRYICINYPLRYRSIMTKKAHYAMATFSYIYSFAVYMILILPHSQFTMDTNGLFNCEPYYYNDKSIIIIAFMLFFIPSILVIIYCYTAIFFVAHRQLKRIEFNSRHDSINRHFIKFENNQMIKERKKLYSSLIILSCISIGFLISISPWTIVEFIGSVWKIKLGRNVDFIVTWIAISNSCMNPILYGLLNKHFRLSCRHFICKCFRVVRSN